MAEPARKLDPDSSGSGRPNLRVIQGGGETSDTEKPNLKLVESRSLYDNNYSKKPITRPNLRVLEGGGGKDEQDQDEDGDETNPKKLSKEQLEEREENGGGNSEDDGDEDDAPFNYTPDPAQKRGGIAGRLKGFSNRKKLAIAAGLGGAMFLVAIVAAIFLFFSSLKIVNLAEHVTVYNMARSARTFRRASAEVTAEKIAVDTSDDVRFAAARERYGALRDKTWGKLDKYRPNKVMQNLRTSGQLEYVFAEEPRTLGLGTKRVFQGANVNGVFIPASEGRFFRPVQGYLSRIQFSAQMEEALGDSLKDYKTFVRNRAVRNELERIGIRRLRFWDRAINKYAGKNQVKAAQIASQQVLETVDEGDATGCASSAVCEGANTAREDIEERVDDIVRDADSTATPKDIEAIAEKEASESIDRSLTRGIFAKIGGVLNSASTVYAIAVPVCLVYDGSTVKNQDNVDKRSAQDQRAYMITSMAKDQIIGGDANATEIGGLTDKIGDITNSIPERRASGIDVDTTAESTPADQPQASTLGSYTAINLIPGLDGAAAGAINSIAGESCSLITNIWGGIAITAAELAFGAASRALGKTAQEGAQKAVEVSLQTKIKKAATRIALETAGVLTASSLLKIMVAQRAATATNGLATDEDFAAQVDRGGVLHANNDVGRGMLYGAPMDSAAVAESKIADYAYLRQQKASASVHDRYFAFDNGYSLVNRLGSSFAGNVSSIIGNPSSIIGSFASILSPSNFAKIVGNLSPWNGVVHAASFSGAGDYNIIQWGWSEDELAYIETEPSLSPLENAAELEGSGKRDEIEAKYKDCYENTVGQLVSGESPKILRNDDGSVVTNRGHCSPQNLGPNNPEYGDLVFRWRLSKRNESVIDHLTGIDDPGKDEAGNNTSGSTTGVTPTIVSGDTSNMTCEVGADAGVGDGYQGGQLFKIRLCTVQGITVNAQVATALNNLINAARLDGHNLSGSGFRTNESQVSLRNEHGCPDPSTPAERCNPPTAIPGYSNHQMGLAIDFTDPGNLPASCRTQSTPCWQWLNLNAGRYGFQNLPSEAWHWSVNGR